MALVGINDRATGLTVDRQLILDRAGGPTRTMAHKVELNTNVLRMLVTVRSSARGVVKKTLQLVSIRLSNVYF